MQKKFMSDDAYMNSGFCFWTPNKLYVVFSMFGDLNIVGYSDFLAMPFIQWVKARNIENSPEDIVEKSTQFVEIVQKLK